MDKPPCELASRLSHHAFRLREVSGLLEEIGMSSSQPGIAKYVLSHAGTLVAMAELVDDIVNDLKGIKA